MNDGKEKVTNREDDKRSVFDDGEERRSGTGEDLDREAPEGNRSSRGEETLEGSRTGIGRKERDGFIYFIETKDSKAVKIGFSIRPGERLWGLRTASPFQLRLIGYLPGTHGTERSLHRRFAEYRMHGEWFQNSGSLQSFIQGIGLIRPEGEDADDWQPTKEPQFVDWQPEVEPELTPKRIRKTSTNAEKNPYFVALGRLGGLKGGIARSENLTDAQLSAIGRKGGRKGGPARAAALTPAKRRAIAQRAAAARWAKRDDDQATRPTSFCLRPFRPTPVTLRRQSRRRPLAPRRP